MNFVCALSLADAAADAPLRIPNDFKFRIYVFDRHYFLPPSRVKMTGSPPRGAQILSSFGAISRIADSSLATYTISSRSPITIERSLSRSFSAIIPPAKPTIIEKGPVIKRLEYTLRR